MKSLDMMNANMHNNSLQLASIADSLTRLVDVVERVESTFFWPVTVIGKVWNGG